MTSLLFAVGIFCLALGIIKKLGLLVGGTILIISAVLIAFWTEEK